MGPPRFLVTLDACAAKDERPPRMDSFFLTGAGIIAFLVGAEQLCRVGLASIKDYHPVFEDETGRQILARHLAVDTLSCVILFCWGWSARGLLQEVWDHFFFDKKGAMSLEQYKWRLYNSFPESSRIATYFFWYQVKNLVDTFIWGDGALFVFHHVFSILTAWAGIGPSAVAAYYGIFFFALSEFSTAILCILANFDDEHGVPGLGDAFPAGKAVCGVLFAITFIICRVITWPIVSKYFFRDCNFALKENDKRTQRSVGWMKFLMVSLSCMTALQILWLGQIFYTLYVELEKMGFI